MRLDWDRCGDDELLLVREMLWGDPLNVLKRHPAERLKEVFLKHVHLFVRENRSFWKLALEVSDEELERACAENRRERFRRSFGAWPY